MSGAAMKSSKPTEKSREQVLEAAEACKRLLREHFGARQVILFGSLAGQSPWHAQSDVDLAVERLAPTAFFDAYSACRDLLPQGAELDLVVLEKVSPEMRARILGEVPIPDDPLLALQALVEDELVALGWVAHS
jgi:predicted nucleotidyltransferase